MNGPAVPGEASWEMSPTFLVLVSGDLCSTLFDSTFWPLEHLGQDEKTASFSSKSIHFRSEANRVE